MKSKDIVELDKHHARNLKQLVNKNRQVKQKGIKKVKKCRQNISSKIQYIKEIQDEAKTNSQKVEYQTKMIKQDYISHGIKKMQQIKSSRNRNNQKHYTHLLESEINLLIMEQILQKDSISEKELRYLLEIQNKDRYKLLILIRDQYDKIFIQQKSQNDGKDDKIRIINNSYEYDLGTSGIQMQRSIQRLSKNLIDNICPANIRVLISNTEKYQDQLRLDNYDIQRLYQVKINYMKIIDQINDLQIILKNNNRLFGIELSKSTMGLSPVQIAKINYVQNHQEIQRIHDLVSISQQNAKNQQFDLQHESFQEIFPSKNSQLSFSITNNQQKIKGENYADSTVHQIKDQRDQGSNQKQIATGHSQNPSQKQSDEEQNQYLQNIRKSLIFRFLKFQLNLESQKIEGNV